MGPTRGPPGSCRPHMCPMLAPWTLLSGICCNHCHGSWVFRSRSLNIKYIGLKLFRCMMFISKTNLYTNHQYIGIGPDYITFSPLSNPVILCGAVITRLIFSRIVTKDTHSSPVRARYGVSFVGSDSRLYSDLVTAVVCAIVCSIGSRYNGTRL